MCDAFTSVAAVSLPLWLLLLLFCPFRNEAISIGDCCPLCLETCVFVRFFQITNELRATVTYVCGVRKVKRKKSGSRESAESASRN